MNTAEIVVKRSMLESLGGNTYAVRLSAPLPVHEGDEFGANYYLSVQPDGSPYQSRTVVGAWETGTLVGDLLVFEQVGVLSRAIRVVNL